jgi:alpha-ketoglutarate-dependent taurine dioxygenase
MTDTAKDGRIACEPLAGAASRAVIVRPTRALGLADWLQADRARVDRLLVEHGAVLFRAFDDPSEPELRRVVAAFSQPLEYVYRSTPRTELGDGLYTATEYPSRRTIPLHSENSYQRAWPLRLVFYCAQPAATGGATTLADLGAVTASIPPELVAEFEAREVLYTRNYRKHLDLPWQVVFQTERKQDVEAYCATHGIAWDWTTTGDLRTRQVCQGVARHPVRGDRVWFNQAHLFHIAGFDRAEQRAIRSMLREQDFPRSAHFGDGGPIDPSAIVAINAAFQHHVIDVPWAAGDVLLVDNMQMAHGRRPFTGERRVLVALFDPHAPARGD